MLEDIFVIDDFYDEPNYIRDLAIHANYQKFPDDSNFPGYESIDSFYSEQHIEIFKSLSQKKSIEIDTSSFVFGKFRYSPINAKSRADIHVDTPIWAAMIYLSLDKDCRGGLGIYAHKETGIYKVPESKEGFHRLGYANFNDMDSKLIFPDSKKISSWEMIEFIPMKYNRLVLFKGSKYFHSITEKFGTDVYDSRLTHSFFFN